MLIILAIRVLFAPLLIAAATLAGRRWGPAVSGWLIGFPFISAPISMVLALQNGPEFAGDAAVGTLAGQATVCMFSAAYIILSRKMNWRYTGLTSVLVFFACAAVWNKLSWPLLPTFLVLMVVILLLIRLAPHHKLTGTRQEPPAWDLPLRMLIAAVFIAALTGLAQLLGPQMSGLFSAFPVFGLILASFTYARQGAESVRQLLRGSILGSFGIAAFYMVVGALLEPVGSLWIYALAALASLVANGISLVFTRPDRIKARQAGLPG